MLLLLLLLLLFSTTTTAQWYKQSSGTCTTPIATAAECKTATTMWNGSPRTPTASTLQPRNTIVTEVDLSDEPAGCIATNFAKTGDPNTGGMAVQFNTNTVTTAACDGGTACICKYSEGCPVNTYQTASPCRLDGSGGRGASIKRCDDSTCKECEDGQYQDKIGTGNSCKSCKENELLNKDGTSWKCVVCDGTIWNGGCVTCASGKFGNSDDSCVDCPIGFFSLSKGSVECANCQENDKSSKKYTDQAGQASCKECAEGKEMKQEKVSEKCAASAGRTCARKNIGCLNSHAERRGGAQKMLSGAVLTAAAALFLCANAAA